MGKAHPYQTDRHNQNTRHPPPSPTSVSKFADICKCTTTALSCKQASKISADQTKQPVCAVRHRHVRLRFTQISGDPRVVQGRSLTRSLPDTFVCGRAAGTHDQWHGEEVNRWASTR
jgi:hypothetical protein